MDLPASAVVVPLPRNLTWRVIPLPRDMAMSAWLAGPPFAVHCHHAGKVSKPCWRLLTRGKLQCPMCGVSNKRLIAYVPLILRGDESRRVVIISKTILPEIEKLPLWQPVVCLGAKQRGFPGVVRATDDVSLQNSTWSKLKKRPAEDVREYLLRVLWGQPDLCRFFGFEPWNNE